ncbi:MAG: protein phosphatase 2C domain-containing protein [Betaproteobacteria bacterium]
MMQDFLEISGLTDVGKVRQFNEDQIGIDAETGTVLVADGMGGHHAGEVASRMATDMIMADLHARIDQLGPGAGSITPLYAADQAIKRANRAVFAASQTQTAYHGMGTTLALAIFHDNNVVLAHVGDSRIYRLRGNVLQLLTRDDSMLRDQVDLGFISAADASESHNRSLVTRAIGAAENVKVHLRDERVLPGDIFLVCSDGLTDIVEERDIELILSSLRTNLPLACLHLIQTAKDNGGYDNVSAILVRVLERFPAGQRSRFLAWLRSLFN